MMTRLCKKVQNILDYLRDRTLSYMVNEDGDYSRCSELSFTAFPPDSAECSPAIAVKVAQ